MRSLHRIAVDRFLRSAIPSTPGLTCLHLGSGATPRGVYRPPAGQRWVDADLMGGHVRADFHSLPFRTRTFDVIRFTEAVYHTVYVRGVLSECGRVLKSRGRLVITAPLLFSQINQDDCMRLTETGWRRVLPFGSVEITPLGGYWSHLVSHLEHASRVFAALRPLARLDDGRYPTALGIICW